MGSCPSFFKFSIHTPAHTVSEPSSIKIVDQLSENSIINPNNLQIDLIMEHDLNPNILAGNRKKDTELSIDSPIKSPKV